MHLLDFPNEIFLVICDYLEYENDINAFSQTNRRLYALLNRRLYRRLLQNLPSPALEWAAENGKAACVRRLLEAGVPPDMAEKKEESCPPFLLAARAGYAEIVQLFLDHGVDPNHVSGYYGKHEQHSLRCCVRFGNPLTAAVKGGHESVVQLLINHGFNLKVEREDYADRPLCLAAASGNASLIELLLRHGCDPDAFDGSGAHPLSRATNVEIAQMLLGPHTRDVIMISGQFSILDRAARSGNIPLVKFLLEMGADPSKVRWSSLAFSNAPHPELPKVAQLLLERLDVDQASEDDSIRQALLNGAAIAGLEDLMERLLEDVNGLSSDLLQDPLRLAVRLGHTTIVELLLSHGANPNDGSETKPLSIAVQKGQDDIVKLLLDWGADPFIINGYQKGEELLNDAISSGRRQVIRLLLEKGATFGESNTDPACSSTCWAAHRVSDFKLLLEYGIKLEPGREEHQRALGIAALFAKKPILKIFLEAGFDVNSRYPDDNHEFILCMAAQSRSREAAEKAVDFLLAQGADIEARDPDTNLTPLLNICSFTDPDMDIHSFWQPVPAARLLLEKGADPFATNNDNVSAFSVAANNGFWRFIKTLLEFWEEQAKPFDEVKDHVLAAARSTKHREVARLLWRYYWPRVYPAGK